MHPKVHQALTRITLDTFASCLPEYLTSHAGQIIDGTKAEDRLWGPSRVKNWHFYRRAGSPILEQTRWLRMRPTSEYIFAERVKEMQSCAIDDPKRYEYLGRILHHIQDMSTPSHVRPVYHGPVLHDHFGDGERSRVRAAVKRLLGGLRRKRRPETTRLRAVRKTSQGL